MAATISISLILLTRRCCAYLGSDECVSMGGALTRWLGGGGGGAIVGAGGGPIVA